MTGATANHALASFNCFYSMVLADPYASYVYLDLGIDDIQKRKLFSRVPVQPSRKGGRRFPVSLLLLDAVCYDEQLLLRDTHPQRAPCREKDESVLSLYIAIYRPNL